MDETSGFVDKLLRPISEETPCGEDISFSADYDRIREAQTSEEDLPQGDWQRETKVADWSKVRTLAIDVLSHKSKDLEIACWLAQSLTYLEGFPGVEKGLGLILRMISDFWDCFHPIVEDGDEGARAGRLEWLDKHLGQAISTIPLTSAGERNYAWTHWFESRHLEELIRKNPGKREELLAEKSKVSAEDFEKASSATPSSFYFSIMQSVSRCRALCSQLGASVDALFKADPPALRTIEGSLEKCNDLLDSIARQRGLSAPDPTENASSDEVQAGPEGLAGRMSTESVIEDRKSDRLDRDEALRRLSEIAAFFRKSEPHSPVPFLIERAVRWGRMPFEEWLGEVVKDGNVLGDLHETLGIRKLDEEE